MKLIINADDCGRTSKQTQHIAQAIGSGLLTSTTIMANMTDTDNAVKLFKEYNSQVSFGLHINLTEGSPLLYSQALLDIGFYKEVANCIEFNGMAYFRNFLNLKCREDIQKEILAQANRLRDCGVQLSHIDGHNHIHTASFMTFLLPKVLKDLGLNKSRSIRNYIPMSASLLARKGWVLLQKLQTSGLVMTDKFCSVSTFLDDPTLCHADTIELMCHPGHEERRYQEEEVRLLSCNIKQYGELINYNQL